MWELLKPYSKGECSSEHRERFWSSWSNGSRERLGSTESVRSLIQIEACNDQGSQRRIFSLNLDNTSVPEHGQFDQPETVKATNSAAHSKSPLKMRLGREKALPGKDLEKLSRSTIDVSSFDSSSVDLQDDTLSTPRFDNKSFRTNEDSFVSFPPSSSVPSKFWPWSAKKSSSDNMNKNHKNTTDDVSDDLVPSTASLTPKDHDQYDSGSTAEIFSLNESSKIEVKTSFWSWTSKKNINHDQNNMNGQHLDVTVKNNFMPEDEETDNNTSSPSENSTHIEQEGMETITLRPWSIKKDSICDEIQTDDSEKERKNNLITHPETIILKTSETGEE